MLFFHFFSDRKIHCFRPRIFTKMWKNAKKVRKKPIVFRPKIIKNDQKSRKMWKFRDFLVIFMSKNPIVFCPDFTRTPSFFIKKVTFSPFFVDFSSKNRQKRQKMGFFRKWLLFLGKTQWGRNEIGAFLGSAPGAPEAREVGDPHFPRYSPLLAHT